MTARTETGEGAAPVSNGRLLDFFAPWCIQCELQRASLVEALAARPRLRLERIDVDAEPGRAAALGVSELPTLVLLRDGVERARRVGAQSAEELARFLDSATESRKG